MIFEKTMQTVKDFESAMNAAKESFDVAKKEIFATYKESMAAEKLKEIREILYETEVKEKAKARESIAADFMETRNKVNSAVTVSTPEDFVSTLEAIRTIGKSISDYEANAFVEKYKGNYTAFRAVLDALHNVGKATDIIAYNAESIEKELLDAEGVIMNWISTFKGTDYYTALLTSDQHSPIKKVATRIQAFIDGGYILGAEDA